MSGLASERTKGGASNVWFEYLAVCAFERVCENVLAKWV